jgi:hypothetical protein
MKNKIVKLEDLELDVYLNELTLKETKPKQKTIDDYFNVIISKKDKCLENTL